MFEQPAPIPPAPPAPSRLLPVTRALLLTGIVAATTSVALEAHPSQTQTALLQTTLDAPSKSPTLTALAARPSLSAPKASHAPQSLKRAPPPPNANRNSKTLPSPKPPAKDAPRFPIPTLKLSYPALPNGPLSSSQKRPVPDYDGRGNSSPNPSPALWVPRVILYPAYLVSEYVIRRPLGELFTLAEKNKWPETVEEFFTFGPRNTMGVIPSGFIDFGLRPSAGLYYFWNEFLTRSNALNARVAFGGTDWWLLQLADRFELDSASSISVHGRYSLRPDNVYHGLGPQSPKLRSRYRSSVAEGALRYATRPWRSSHLTAEAGVRTARFNASIGSGGDDPPLLERLNAGLPTPPGLDGYTITYQTLDLALDSRLERLARLDDTTTDLVQPAGTGVRVDLRSEHAYGVDQPTPAQSPQDHWLRYGATIGGFVDLNGLQRTLGLSLIADFAHSFDKDAEIPFTEQVTLGGSRPLQGFLGTRLID